MKKGFVVFLLLIIAVPLMHAQQELFKSLFIYNFTKNIDWPSEYKSGNFVISIVGQDGITNELKKLAQSKRVGSQPISVKSVNNVSELQKSNIVFISSTKSSSLASVVDKYKSAPTLVISDQGGGCKNGAGINFVLVDGKIKFEISPSKVTAGGLQLSPKLTGLGILVE